MILRSSYSFDSIEELVSEASIYKEVGGGDEGFSWGNMQNG